MNTSTLRGDLSDYARLVWEGRWIIALVTAACVVVMAVLTWAVPRIYLVRSEIDTGALAPAQPVETNLLVEAVDRGQFTVEGALFPETMPKGLTVTWREPSTMILEAKSVDPAGALRRLQAMTAAVQDELLARFRRYAITRETVEERLVVAQNDANARVRQLDRFVEERSATAVATRAAAYADGVRAASQRAWTQLAADSRFRPGLLQLRARLDELPTGTREGSKRLSASLDKVISSLEPDDDPERPATTFEALERDRVRRNALARLSSVPGTTLADVHVVFREIADLDLRVARAAEVQRWADRLRQHDERLALLLSHTSPVSTAEEAKTLVNALADLERVYKENDDAPTVRAIHDTAELLEKLGTVYREADVARGGPSLARVPKVVIAPAMPGQPTWPRPAVNLAIAFLFGLAGSVMFVVLTAGSREK